MGSAVALWVSTGPCPPDSTNVPGVIGSELSSATNAITNALLSVGEVIELCNDEYPEGYVFDQDPVVGLLL
jgi:beta-lactam-binding protein with PASTA domain